MFCRPYACFYATVCLIRKITDSMRHVVKKKVSRKQDSVHLFTLAGTSCIFLIMHSLSFIEPLRTGIQLKQNLFHLLINGANMI